MAIGRTNAGGGGTGGTLTVNAPAGVTVIATNSETGRTYTRTANSDGVAVFKGLATGTYLVHITDGTTTSDNFTADVVADYALTVKFFAAYISVTYPEGSTCTCTDGETTFAATDTSGSYIFTVPNTGTWTVSCTDGSQSTSSSVTITADRQSESIALAYELVLYDWNVGALDYTLIGSQTSAQESGGYLNLSFADQYESGALMALCFTDSIDTTPYKKLTIQYKATYSNTAYATATLNLASTQTGGALISSQLPSSSIDNNVVIDVSDFARDVFVRISRNPLQWWSHGVLVNIYIKKIFLS